VGGRRARSVELRSTRRFGAPITWASAALNRALRQYHGQVLAQQSRFNIQLAVYVGQLADASSASSAGPESERPTSPSGAGRTTR